MTKMETALASERTHLMARVETAERERDNARAQRDAANQERDEARTQASEYHRRAQKAEAVIANGIEAQIGLGGRPNVGRALANSATYHYKDQCDTLADALRDMVDLHNLDGTWREYGRDNLPETVAMRLEVAHSALETYAGRNE